LIAVSIALFALLQTQSAWSCHRYLTCGDLRVCLAEGVDNDIRRIREGASTGNGQEVWEGGNACWNNFDHNHQHDYNAWRVHSGGCTNQDYAELGRDAVNNQCHDRRHKPRRH